MNVAAGKVALISGGGAGIGLQYAKELLRNGLRAVTLADINKVNGENALKEIQEEFGHEKAIFVQVDVAEKDQYEEAFKQTVDKYKNLDIVVNNAGVMNDAIWERQISINLVGTINGCILALENYLPKYKTESEGVIVNVSSVSGLERFQAFPIYAATKRAVIGLTRAWGKEQHYHRTKVRVLALCPGVTDTPLLRECLERNLGPAYQDIMRGNIPHLTIQSAEHVALSLIYVLNNGQNGSVWVSEHSESPYQVGMPSRHELRRK
ncbi:15-hydroxyprostaglandin dehydrogenase [NAD(+)]-like [Photinus pyralis]|uniref:15-hydroxyprostaglandin dehydrogenase n=4 Tax=Photinus pyralis TaxID=7054 RepID=A0A1Y1N5U0_PHOPY|nr:15-hydroxyprostaglandin dehydrogenase [NAD(+)]-like [Photinus pyralis]